MIADTGLVSADETGSFQLVEEYGPTWSPGVFERGTDGPLVILAGVDVVGASEQAGHRLIGSVASRLVRAGRWPVTVVP